MKEGISKEPFKEVYTCSHNGANHDIDGCEFCSCKRVFY